MTVAKWIYREPKYQCSECRMTTSVLSGKCPFCDSLMTNEEEIWIKMFPKEEVDDKNNLTFLKNQDIIKEKKEQK